MRNEIPIDKLGIPVMNQVFVKITDIEDSFKTKGGIIAKSDFVPEAWSNSEGHSVTDFIARSGVVAAIPKIITSHGYDYETECEIQVGDTVFWSIGSFESCSVLVCSGEKFLSINYHKLLIRERDGDILPLNGNVLLTSVSKVRTALSYTVTDKLSNLWDICQMPEKIPVSKIPRRNGEMYWEVGDRVIISVNQSAMKIEGDINKSLDKELYCVPWHFILCDTEK